MICSKQLNRLSREQLKVSQDPRLTYNAKSLYKYTSSSTSEQLTTVKRIASKDNLNLYNSDKSLETPRSTSKLIATLNTSYFRFQDLLPMIN